MQAQQAEKDRAARLKRRHLNNGPNYSDDNEQIKRDRMMRLFHLDDRFNVVDERGFLFHSNTRSKNDKTSCSF